MFWGQNLLIASPKGEMKRTFSWASFYKIHTSGTLCLAQPTLENLNQAKLLYSIKLSSETEFCITMHTPLCEPAVHTGTSLSVLKSPSGTDRVSDCHSSLVTTPSSRRILHKPKIEVTKLLIHHVGKNGKHFYGENSIYEYPTKRHIKSNQHMGILCWKPSSPFSNVHFRNTTKNCSTSSLLLTFVTFTFEPFLKL